MKTRRRKTARPSRRKQATAGRGRASSAANLEEQLDQRTRERDQTERGNARDDRWDVFQETRQLRIRGSAANAPMLSAGRAGRDLRFCEAALADFVRGRG